MSLTDKQIYDLNNMNVAAQNVSLGNMLDEMAFSDSPEFTGTPTAPTAEAGTDNNQIATTAFVQNAVSGGSSGDVVKITMDTDEPDATEIGTAIEAVMTAGKIPILVQGSRDGDVYQLAEWEADDDYSSYTFFKLLPEVTFGTETLGSIYVTMYYVEKDSGVWSISWAAGSFEASSQ